MAARKKSMKTPTVGKAAAKKAAPKPSPKSAARAGKKSAAGGAPAEPAKAPKAGSKEEHYADLRRVALANALARLR